MAKDDKIQRSISLARRFSSPTPPFLFSFLQTACPEQMKKKKKKKKKEKREREREREETQKKKKKRM